MLIQEKRLETYYWYAMWIIKQVAYMGLVGSFPFNSFLAGVLSCIGTAVLAGRSFLRLVALFTLVA